jgi:hypothetical protein
MKGLEMSNETSGTTVSTKKSMLVDAPVKQEDNFRLSLDEFCTRLSAEKVSPEMIGGFHHWQLAEKQTTGSDADYKAAFDAFVNQPA